MTSALPTPPRSHRVVLRARALGMCFGVRDALAATRAVADPENVTVHGELVHNENVLRELDERGFHQVPEDDRNASVHTPRLLLTAHGVSNRERRRLEGQQLDLIDTTCPLVRKAHRHAVELEAAGYTVVVIGKPDHVEVRGLTEDLLRYVIVSRVEDVRRWGFQRIAVVAQTTTRPSDAAAIVDRIHELHPDREVRWTDTICQPTKDRGEALEELLDRVDALVVVGGKNSNNTRQLVRRAEVRNVPALHVQSAADLAADWLAPFAVVGLTAGTSTLSETVDAVEQALRDG